MIRSSSRWMPFPIDRLLFDPWLSIFIGHFVPYTQRGDQWTMTSKCLDDGVEMTAYAFFYPVSPFVDTRSMIMIDHPLLLDGRHWV